MTSSTYNNGVGEARAYNVDNTLASITFPEHRLGRIPTAGTTTKIRHQRLSGHDERLRIRGRLSGYDQEDRLLNWERTIQYLDQSWDLSLVGDWDSFTENSNTQNRTHGPTHELLTAGGQSVTHDTKGNMTLIPSGLRSNASSLALTWDFENKMKTADIGNNSSVDVTYKWDALGRRVYRDDGTSAFVYVQVGQQTIADYGWSVAPASPKYNYVYASYIDEPVMREEPSANERLFFHRSQQFSTVALTTSTATIAERYAYSAYGAPTVCNASGTDIGTSTKDNRITYTGREWDDELVLYHFRARLYDAGVGRFLGRDPIGYDGDSLNIYQFLQTRPLIFVDPTGLYQGPIIPGQPWPIGSKPPSSAPMVPIDFVPKPAIEEIEEVICATFIFIDVITVPSGEGAAGCIATRWTFRTVKKCFRSVFKNRCESLKALKEATCALTTGMRCGSVPTCNELSGNECHAREMLFSACADAREKYQKVCFTKGKANPEWPGHILSIRENAKQREGVVNVRWCGHDSMQVPKRAMAASL
jgi:RHS repeat-associated protein